MQGLGKYQRERRIKTESKIVAFLNLQQFPFNELQLVSGIRRNSLRSSLDSLVIRKIVSKHIIKNPTNKKIRRGTYYSLNSDKPEAKRLLDAYYDDKEGKPPITKELKKEVLTSLEKFRRNVEEEDDVIAKQISTFKNEIEPLIDKPQKSVMAWFDSIALYEHHQHIMQKMLKIFAVKLRLRLPDRRKS
jgi:hypothetical protein